MSNVISMVGRIGQDAVFKDVGSNSVLEFSIANNTGYGDKQVGTWYKCAMWGKRGEKIVSFLTKGSQIWICGELTPRPWTSKEGVEKISMDINVTAIDFVGSKKEASESPKSDEPTYERKPAKTEETTEELPF